MSSDRHQRWANAERARSALTTNRPWSRSTSGLSTATNAARGVTRSADHGYSSETKAKDQDYYFNFYSSLQNQYVHFSRITLITV